MHYENLLRKRWEEREKTLPEETKQQIAKMYSDRPGKYQLEVIKRKRIIPQKGDVFILKPQLSDYYFTGVVLFGEIHTWAHEDLDNLSIVAIFNNKTKSLNDIQFEMDFDNLLIAPGFVPKEYWSKGLFYNIGVKVKIPENLDFGIYNSISCDYEDAYGNKLDRIPYIIGSDGITTGMGIAYKINTELYINKDLLREQSKTVEKESKISGFFSAKNTNVLLQIKARLQPMHRWGIFEKFIEKELKRKRIGKIINSGTIQGANGEITGCTIEINMKTRKQEEFLTFLEQLPIPKGSFFQTETDRIEIGKMEGLAVYLNGTDLPPEVYASCDVNDLIKMLEKSLGQMGRLYSYWEGNRETVLYFYGIRFEEMKQKISGITDKYPLCEKCKIIRIS